MLGRERRRHATLTVLLWAGGLGTVFLSAPTTEALFAAAAFSGMRAVAARRWLLAAAAFALGTATRSNGVVHAGFFAWHLALQPVCVGVRGWRLVGGFFLFRVAV